MAGAPVGPALPSPEPGLRVSDRGAGEGVRDGVGGGEGQRREGGGR